MKKYGYLVGIALFIIMIGILLMLLDIQSLEVIDDLPNSFESNIKIYEYSNNQSVYIKYNKDKVNVVSNDYIDGIQVEVFYYPYYDNVSIKETYKEDSAYLEISDQRSYHLYKVLNHAMKNLSKHRLYNYSLLYDAKVTVYVNHNLKEKVILNG